MPCICVLEWPFLLENFFFQSVAKLGGENKTRICFTKITNIVTCFDLWVSQGAHDNFSLVIKIVGLMIYSLLFV
jgi:hypothetical protein